MALGAQRGDIVWLFTRRAFVSLSVGLVAGIAGVLVVVAAVASVWPARRATRVRPAIALRTE